MTYAQAPQLKLETINAPVIAEVQNASAAENTSSGFADKYGIKTAREIALTPTKNASPEEVTAIGNFNQEESMRIEERLKINGKNPDGSPIGSKKPESTRPKSESRTSNSESKKPSLNKEKALALGINGIKTSERTIRFSSIEKQTAFVNKIQAKINSLPAEKKALLGSEPVKVNGDKVTLNPKIFNSIMKSLSK